MHCSTQFQRHLYFPTLAFRVSISLNSTNSTRFVCFADTFAEQRAPPLSALCVALPLHGTMTDIQQWRRMIPRARTPAVDLEDLDGLLSPTTPRKGLKPKLSSYFTQNSAYVEPRSGLSIGSDLLSPQWPTPVELPLPVPEVENLIEAIMCRLLANPCERLDVRFNAILLQIFESFRALDDEKKHLMADVQEQRDRREAREREMQLSYQKWEREKTEFKAEVRRLELILANGKRGLAEVTLARQDSVLRSRRKYEDSSAMEDEAMETIFEFLEKTKRYEDKAWSSQRGKVS